MNVNVNVNVQLKLKLKQCAVRVRSSTDLHVHVPATAHKPTVVVVVLAHSGVYKDRAHRNIARTEGAFAIAVAVANCKLKLPLKSGMLIVDCPHCGHRHDHELRAVGMRLPLFTCIWACYFNFDGRQQ
jgi:hypothetical protein